jgi:hypothetical protein
MGMVLRVSADYVQAVVRRRGRRPGRRDEPHRCHQLDRLGTGLLAVKGWMRHWTLAPGNAMLQPLATLFLAYLGIGGGGLAAFYGWR